MKNLIEVSNVFKSYGNFTALNNVNINLEKGRIYGFIGENGAGKTTLIRLLAGLSSCDKGEIRIKGEKLTENNSTLRKSMGFMVERPIYHENMTVADNIKLQKYLHGMNDYEKIPSLIEKVGLKNVEDKKVKDFSLGMRQRVGIAMALANNPEILILDEPVNGLDPVGMVDVRNILTNLNKKEGITIFISSHILGELYQLATDFIIISKGNIVKCISSDELRDKTQKNIMIKTNDNDKLENILKTKGISKMSSSEDKNTIIINDSSIHGKDIGKICYDEKIMVEMLSENDMSLEEYYLSILGGKHV